MTFDLSLQQILLRIVAVLVIGAIHGLALAGVAAAFGDRGPRFDGRVTANPFAHVDPLGVVVAVATLGGWIRPINIDPAELRQGRLSLVIAVLVSLAIVLVVGQILLPLRALTVATLPPSASNLINIWLQLFAQMSVVFAIMNLIPLPPFSGGHLLQALAPNLYAKALSRITIIAVVIAVLALIDRGAVVRAVLGPLVRAITGF